ncbi:MAG TPA: TetR/AcrR family transcriptional regulator [Vicinamibacterales bacterium]|nr:TetR/AcrR family transcriptional regulator [Vicinamibacterales bacterium]
MPPSRKQPPTVSTREAVFNAGATLFSARGFDGVSVDDIAALAGVNKAMIYYHFTDKIAVYRAVVADMLTAVSGSVAEIAASEADPQQKLNRFIENFVRHAEQRPWFPLLMLREMAEGAPHLDLPTLGYIRDVFAGFGRILAEGEQTGAFRKVNPILAYASVVGPLVLNAARERVAAQPGRQHLPMLTAVSHADLIAHGQETARRMLMP